MKKQLMFSFVIGTLALAGITPLAVKTIDIKSGNTPIVPAADAVQPAVTFGDWEVSDDGTEASRTLEVTDWGMKTDGSTNFSKDDYVSTSLNIEYNNGFGDNGTLGSKSYIEDDATPDDDIYVLKIEGLEANTNYTKLTGDVEFLDVDGEDNASFTYSTAEGFNDLFTIKFSPTIGFGAWMVSTDKTAATLTFEIDEWGMQTDGTTPYDDTSYNKAQTKVMYGEDSTPIKYSIQDDANTEDNIYTLTLSGLEQGMIYSDVVFDLALDDDGAAPVTTIFTYDFNDVNTKLHRPKIDFDNSWEVADSGESATMGFTVQDYGWQTDGLAQYSSENYNSSGTKIIHGVNKEKLGTSFTLTRDAENNDNYVITVDGLDPDTTYEAIIFVLGLDNSDSGTQAPASSYNYLVPSLATDIGGGETGNSNDLDGWAIAGIVIGGLILLTLLGYAGYFIYSKQSGSEA